MYRFLILKNLVLLLIFLLLGNGWCLMTAVDDTILQQVSREHSEEISNGFRIFGTTSSPPIVSWSSSDFNIISLGEGNAGPSESCLKRGSDIFITKQPIISNEECQELIEEAKAIIARGSSDETSIRDSTSLIRTNSQLNEAKVSELLKGKGWVKDLLHQKLLPMLEYAYGVDSSSLTLNDGLVLGYIAPSKSQPIHRDASLLTLQIALSPSTDFTEGGTYFEGLKEAVQIEAGHAMCHSSGSMHAGRGITSGERWVMVMFVLAKDEPQLAKRLHAAGVSAMDQKNYDLAESYYLSGLEEAPNDHLLRMSLANCYLSKNSGKKAREQLSLAQSYQPCTRAFLLHANQLVSLSRPRSALRRLERALDQIADQDLNPEAWTPFKALAWETRVQAGRCACLCAEKELSLGTKDLTWSRSHLPEAIQRMQIALRVAPGHEPLQGMIDRAQQILNMANEQY